MSAEIVPHAFPRTMIFVFVEFESRPIPILLVASISEVEDSHLLGFVVPDMCRILLRVWTSCNFYDTLLHVHCSIGGHENLYVSGKKVI